MQYIQCVRSIALASLLTSVSYGQTAASPATVFGDKDQRGAYQEVRIRPFKLHLNYFTKDLQAELLEDAKFLSENRRGRFVEIYFQDGAPRSLNPEAQIYGPLDSQKSYAVFYARVRFETEAQKERGFFNMDGIITLVTGHYEFGPFANPRPKDFKQLSVMGYENSGADCRPQCKDGFNSFGNGKRDRGNIFEAGIVTQKTDVLTTNDFLEAVGTWAQIFYP